MPRGSTESPYGLGERKQKAFNRFAQGWTNTEVAEELEVSPNTVSRYRKAYEEEIRDAAIGNPRLLENFLENTLRLMREADVARAEAWRLYEDAHNQSVRAQALNIIRGLQADRARLFGVLGVRAEYFQRVERTRTVAERLIAFMMAELCTADKRKLEALLTSEDMRDFFAQPAIPAGAEEVA